jgi:hypothetical protein
MQRLIANFSGRALRRTENGRTWLVAPVSMLVPGVLAGSRGPLYYPPEVVARDVQNWDLQPLTLGHPPCSAHAEGVYDRQGLGAVRNPRFEGGRLRAEAWFDAERTRRIAPDVFNRLERGEPIEVSTGLYTKERPAPQGSAWRGREYSHTVIDFTPDHLAILPDQRGACSLDDGCGVHNEELDMTHNCNCHTHNAEGIAGGLPLPSTATEPEPTLNAEQRMEQRARQAAGRGMNPDNFGVLPLPSTASPPTPAVQNKQGARQAAGRGIGSIDHDGGMIVG